MILAAGEGTRLRPLTIDIPKSLLRIGGVPLIEHQIAWLRRYGITRVAVNLYHQGEKLRDYLGDGSDYGVELLYSAEHTLLGTAGGVKKIEPFFDGTFVVLYGDVLTGFDLAKMLAYHREKKALVTLALFNVPNPWDVGIVEIDETGRVLTFVEKPATEFKKGNLSNGGIYILEREICQYIITNNGYCDFAYDVFPRLLKNNMAVYGYVLEKDEYLLDIGTLDKYHRANNDAEAGRVKIFR